MNSTQMFKTTVIDQFNKLQHAELCWLEKQLNCEITIDHNFNRVIVFKANTETKIMEFLNWFNVLPIRYK